MTETRAHYHSRFPEIVDLSGININTNASTTASTTTSTTTSTNANINAITNINASTNANASTTTNAITNANVEGRVVSPSSNSSYYRVNIERIRNLRVNMITDIVLCITMVSLVAFVIYILATESFVMQM